MSRAIYWCATFVAVAALVGAGSIRAQEPRAALPIARVLEDRDGDYVPDSIGRTVRVQGVVTLPPRRSRGTWVYAVVQDSTGAIRISTRDGAVLWGRIRTGDRVEVEGSVLQFAGAEEIEIATLQVLDRGPLVRPLPVTAADLNGERYAQQLVTVTGRLETRSEMYEREFYVVDDTGEIEVWLPWRFSNDSAFVARLEGLGRVRVTGIAVQWKLAPPFDSGYRLLARDPADFEFLPPSLHYRLAILGGAALLIVSWTLVLLSLTKRRAEQEAYRRSLEESERRFRHFFENASDALFLHDESGRFIDVNRRACESLGYSRDELLGLTVADVELDLEPGRIDERWQRMRPGDVLTIEGRHRRKDGSEFPVEIQLSRFEFGGRAYMLADVRDTTERRRLEEQLMQAMKLEAVGRLAGGIAHDFNNVLTAIRGHCQLLLEGRGPSDPANAELKAIESSADRAASLTRQLLAFSRQQVLEPRVVCPDGVIDDMKPMLSRLISEDIKLEVTIAPDVGRILVDRGQLEQVILNLAINARDAMPRGGRLSIELENEEITPAKAARFPEHVEPGPYVRLSVADTGVGIEPEMMPRIFEPFFTTKEVGKGTGLGLATVYGIIKQSGGHIRADSKSGAGTRFDVYLPHVSGPVAEDGVPVATEAPPIAENDRQSTILLVEDEGAVRTLIERVLRRDGYIVLSAENGAEALRICEDAQQDIDLLITDVVMPELGGAQLVDRVAQLRPRTRVLFMTGYTREDVANRGLRGPLLEKPFSPHELARKVKELLQTTEWSDRRATDAERPWSKRERVAAGFPA